MSGSPLSPKFPAVELHQRTPSAPVHGGDGLSPLNLNLQYKLSIYLYMYLIQLPIYISISISIYLFTYCWQSVQRPNSWGEVLFRYQRDNLAGIWAWNQNGNNFKNFKNGITYYKMYGVISFLKLFGLWFRPLNVASISIFFGVPLETCL